MTSRMQAAKASPRARLRARAAAAGCSLVEALGPLPGEDSPEPRHTLLAVCPNSVAVTRAALGAAQEANAPLLFAATLNQVDLDGGYTGWTPAALAAFVASECDRLNLDTPVVLCLDHGGPWKKDLHASSGLSFEATMDAVRHTLEACIDAGYGLLHIDPTVDKRLPPGEPVPVPIIVERTVGLMQHAEAYRQRQGVPPLAYEVGTEEVGGPLRGKQRFSAFLDTLATALAAHGLPRPCFVVGDVGTTLDSTHFDGARARRLAAIARAFGARIKGHYTDGVALPEAYPLCGVGGANVGPGLAAVEYEALMDLVRLERHLGCEAAFPEALREAVVASDRWRKWLHADEAGASFEALPASRQDWLVRTGSRYVWSHPAVVEARQRLYDNVRAYRNPEAFVQWHLRHAMLRYFHAFNLIDFNDLG